MSDGETIEEAITNGIDAMRGGIEAMRAEGHPIPAPTRSAAADGARTEADVHVDAADWQMALCPRHTQAVRGCFS
jgi:hypothetical protein